MLPLVTNALEDLKVAIKGAFGSRLLSSLMRGQFFPQRQLESYGSRSRPARPFWRKFMVRRGRQPQQLLKRTEIDQLGWRPVAELLSRDSQLFRPDAKRCRLPEEFERIEVVMFPLGSGLTA